MKIAVPKTKNVAVMKVRAAKPPKVPKPPKPPKIPVVRPAHVK
jgi:hypothetical protein